MIELPAPVLVEHDGVMVLRDDLLLGGTKVRAIIGKLGSADEWVYAAPAQGYAQLALAVTCELEGKQATIFTARRKEPHPLTVQTIEHGAKVVWIANGRLSNVRAKARSYCELTGARFIEVGLRIPGMEESMTDIARALPFDPAEVWITAGSGTLACALGAAWPDKPINVVRVGMEPRLPPNAVLWTAPEPFERPATGPLPPFSSPLTYDAKAWRFVVEHARKDGRALFWNVGA